MSLNSVEELTSASFKIIEMLRYPMVILFVNTEDEACRRAIITLKEASKFFSNIVFVYSAREDYKSRKVHLGITWDEEPAMAIHQLATNQGFAFPNNKPLTLNNIRGFVNGY
jgi:hypothetical protein